MKKFTKGFSYAWNGLTYAFATQINFKIHVFAAFLAITLGLYVNLNHSEWLWISTAILFVLIVELLNTAIEILVNLVSPEYDPKAGIIKDISAAAVLITAFFALIVGLFIFVPKII